MKIKNILHSAALRFCLIALAMGTAVAVSAQENNSESAAFYATKLISVNNLYVSASENFPTTNTDGKYIVAANTYYDRVYDSYKWYHYGNNDRSVVTKGSTKEDCFMFKIFDAIVCKLGSAGDYNVTVSYFSTEDDGAVWYYLGDSYKGSTDFSVEDDNYIKGKTNNTFVEKTFSFTTTNANQLLWVSGGSGTAYLHSIKVEKIETPTAPYLNAITEPYFWYFNGGEGFSNGSIYGPDGKNLHYRHLPGTNHRVEASRAQNKTTQGVNYVYINGEEIGGDNSNAGGTEYWGSYIFEKDDAIGFKLDSGKDYRIKVYLVDRGSEIDNRVLYKGVNVETATRVDANVYQQTINIMENGAPKGTNTRLITYEINKANAGVYWIKNAIDAQLFIGGFEVLPKNYPGFADVFTGENGWYVKDNCCDPKTTALSSTQTVDYPVSGNNVVVYGPDMATNFFDLSGRRTVMLNNGSKFGVRLKKGAKLTFTIAGDQGVKVKITDKDGNQLVEEGDGGFTNVEYTATANQEIWITGSSEQYVYFSGFEVTQPEEKPSPLDAAKAISEDYVWYPVDRDQFAANALIDDYVYVTTLQSDEKDASKLRTSKYTLYKKEHIAYRTGGGSQLGFKIEADKKGVINAYYDKNPGYFPLYEGNTKDNDGKKMTMTTSSVDGAVIAQYYFDTTGGSKTYWFDRSGDMWFGGFEVLFDVEIGAGHGLYRGIDNKYTVTEKKKDVKNALSDDVYKVISESPVCGPSMIIRQPATDINGVVLFNRGDVRNSILMNVSNEYNNIKYLNVTGYLDGATIRIYKGAPSPSNTAYVEVTGSEKIDKIVSLESLGDISGAYYVTSNDAAGAYLTSLTLKGGTFTELQPTDVNYIYKVNGVPSSGVQNSGDTNGRILFIDGGNAAQTDGNSKMNVLGSEVTPVAIENGKDFFAVKVDQGPYGVKTGYIKVYFNGGSAAAHQMEELPLDNPLYAGSNSSYDPDKQTITFEAGGGNRGWLYGTGTDAKNLSAYNKINIEVDAVGGDTQGLQLIVQDVDGNAIAVDYDADNKRFLGDLTGGNINLSAISQIYIQDWRENSTGSTVKIKSARLMNKPLVIATDSDQDPTNGYTELFGGKIYDLPDGKLYEYPFDLSKEGASIPQFIWITGAGNDPNKNTTNIAAIEVLYDSHHAKVVDWYVNKDTKMIVGSDDPAFKINFQNQTLEYPSGYDEYVTFYMSSGRQANVSFIMPEAVREVDEWFALVTPLGKDAQDGGDYVKESKVANIANTYGKHTIDITGVGSGDKLGIASGDNISFQSHTTLTYDRDNAISADRGKINGSGPLYKWYNYAYDLPANIFDKDYTNKDFAAAVKVTATQKVNGSDDTETVGGKEGQWKIYMRFISFAAPEASRSGNDVSVAGGQSGKSIYYTMDSSEPENLGDTSINSARSTTEPYNSSVNVADMNCIFKAAQYIKTDYHFYEDISKGKDSAIGNVFKVVSRDLAIENEISSVVYVQDPKPDDGKAQIFNKQEGGYMLTIPTGDVMSGVTPHEQKYNANPFMYLTLGGKDWPYYIGNNAFNLCGTNWKASNDGGLKTYLDSYQNKFDVDGAKNILPWDTSSNQNQNPYTECNGGVGGSDTEDGGMFLQPIGGTSLRFEPEYDGVITVWLRQNGCLDNNTMESGTFNRRPVYVMDENGRIMRRSTIRPTASHYMGINGTWGINSSVCEQRSQVENTWIAELAKQIYQDHPLYGSRFATKADRWAEEGHDHSGHILYGWWYKGFDLTATRSTATSAAHVSRFEYMEPELLYRSDGIFNMEMNTLGLKNDFAKYGYELPNFQYVRYRIPVKAGKTYYIAGRGTKNGFAAIRFDALAPNTNLVKASMENLRYSDNPEVIENQTPGDNYLKLTNNWDNNGARNYKSTDRSAYDLTGKTTSEVSTAYNYLTTQPFSDTGESNSNTINSIVNEGKSGMDYDKDGNLVGKTINFQLVRTFKAYNWHPIILPFSLSETRVEQYFGEGTKILYLDPYVHSSNNQVDEETGKSWISVLKPALEGTKLSFTSHRYQMLYANTPAFICPTFEWSDGKKNPATNNVKPEVSNGSVTSITFKRVTLDGSNMHDLGDGCFGYAISNDYEVVGSYDQKAHKGDIYYVNNTNPSGGLTGNTAQLVHSENKTVTMKGFRAWIRLKDGRNAAPIKTVGSRGFSDFEEDSDLSGISDIVADDYTIEGYDIEDDSVYDLLGRKIGEGSLDGLQKGIYIFHGRKVYVK